MYTVLVVIQVLVAIALIGLVLIQHGKGADAGAAFGSGASGTVFGARGSANFLSRSTAVLALVFFVSSLGLAWMIRNAPVQTDSVVAAPVNGSVTDGSPIQLIPAESSADGASEAPNEVPAEVGAVTEEIEAEAESYQPLEAPE